MIHKQLRGAGKPHIAGRSNGNIPMLANIKGLAHNIVAGPKDNFTYNVNFTCPQGKLS